MELIDIRKLEDCFDGGLKLEYRFSGPVSDTFMRQLASGARLDFFPEFPKPFFKIFRTDGVQLKGILGAPDIEAYFPRTDSDRIQDGFEGELNELLNG